MIQVFLILGVMFIIAFLIGLKMVLNYKKSEKQNEKVSVDTVKS